MDCVMVRLLAAFEPGDVVAWPWDDPQGPWRWDPTKAPWPRLIAAVRQQSPQSAALEILAWALGSGSAT